MKSLIIVLAFVLVSLCATAEDSSWLEVEWAFQLGWIREGALHYYSTSDIYGMASFDAVFSIQCLIFNIIKVGGSWTNNFSDTKENDFFPNGMDYSINFGFEPIKGISINYWHSCFHPVATFMDKRNGSINFEGGYTRIFFEFKSKINY